MVDGGHVFPMSFVGVYSPITGPILEGPHGQKSIIIVNPDLVEAHVGRTGDDAASRSDPTFTRACPGLRQ